MADATPRRPASPLLAFLLGATVVALAMAIWFIFMRATPEPVDVPGVTIEAPKLPDINMPDAPKLPRG